MEQIQKLQWICIIANTEETNVPLLNRCYFSFFEQVCWWWRADSLLLEYLSPCVVMWFTTLHNEQNLSPPSLGRTTESPCREDSGEVGFGAQETIFFHFVMSFHSLLPASFSDALVVCHRPVILCKAVRMFIYWTQHLLLFWSWCSAEQWLLCAILWLHHPRSHFPCLFCRFSSSANCLSSCSNFSSCNAVLLCGGIYFFVVVIKTQYLPWLLS